MKFISAKEVAELLQCNVSTVRINAGKGRYPFRMIRIGSLYKFPEEEVKAYLYGSDYKPTEAEDENRTDD